jgi:Amt family ammonium transporter
MTANGLLAGLVSVCSIAAVASWIGTIAVGLIAGVQVVLVFDLLERVGIDDVCAVFPVHGSAGLLSALAFPFVDTTSAFSVSQLAIQIAGVVVLAVWAAAVTGLVYGGLKMAGWARVSQEEEVEGLDAAEHGVETYPEFGETVPGEPAGARSTAADGGQGVTDDD